MKAKPQVGQTPVDRVFRLLGLPVEQPGHFAGAMTQEMKGAGSSPRFHQGLQAIAQLPSQLFAQAVLFWIGGLGSWHFGVFVLAEWLFGATPPMPDFVDKGAVGESREIKRRPDRFSLTLGLDFHHLQHRGLNQIVSMLGQPGRTDPGDGGRQLPAQRLPVDIVPILGGGSR